MHLLAVLVHAILWFIETMFSFKKSFPLYVRLLIFLICVPRQLLIIVVLCVLLKAFPGITIKYSSICVWRIRTVLVVFFLPILAAAVCDGLAAGIQPQDCLLLWAGEGSQQPPACLRRQVLCSGFAAHVCFGPDTSSLETAMM